MGASFRLGIDVGGTFTDAVLVSEDTGEIQISKVLSTPDDPSVGFLSALEQILAKASVAPREVSYLVHGTTVATNALIEGKTPKTAFVTTDGFRDMLEIGRQVRPSLYDLQFRKLRPLVRRYLAFEVPERLDAAGGVLRELDEQRVLEIADQLKAEGVCSVAVCLLHSYLNPAHEERVELLLQNRNPDLAVSISSRICPEFREYFRASTTVINACIQPVIAGYVQGICAKLASLGVNTDLLIMQSNGGVLTSKQAAEKPVYMVESGPAAGVIAANFLGSILGHSNIISFDMGGTTAKAGLIMGGRPRVTKDYEVGAEARPGVGQSRGSGYPIRTPVIDLVEIGAGGGSIAWVDPGRVLRVGPHSSGAAPGPICYGNGGTEPTITDANVVLGRINPDNFLGGKMRLDAAAAARGIQEKCAEPLGLDLLEAANGIIEIANAAMINAVRIATVRRGYDPRDLVMVAFGGGGPLHANRLADEMKIPLLVVPMSPGTTSALGLLATDLKHEFSRTRLMRAAHADVNLINTVFAAMERQGGEVLRLEGVPDKGMSFLREIEMRYVGQSYELGVVCPGGVLSPHDLKETCSRFHAEHERTYGRGYPQEAVELVNFRLTAVGAIDKPQLRKITTEAPLDARVIGPRPVFFAEAGGFTETAVYDRYLLWAGQKIEGPAVIEEMDSNTLIHPGFGAVVDPFGNLLISRAH